MININKKQKLTIEPTIDPIYEEEEEETTTVEGPTKISS